VPRRMTISRVFTLRVPRGLMYVRGATRMAKRSRRSKKCRLAKVLGIMNIRQPSSGFIDIPEICCSVIYSQ
jgi:hypothetical protein